MPLITWSRFGGYECSSKGDARFSAFRARMPDGRSIEEWYQCDVKGYDPGGTAWRSGKGVCQDIAHITIGALRAVGIPARYVSGYLHPVPDPEIGEPAIGESHAWVEWFARP